MSRLDDALTSELSGDDDWKTWFSDAFKVGWKAAVESDEVSTQEQLDALPAGTMVFYASYYDGWWATTAMKDRDGVWRERYDPRDDGVEVHPWIPCKIVFRPEEDA